MGNRTKPKAGGEVVAVGVELPVMAQASPAAPAVPVARPLRVRHDGMTPRRQQVIVEAMARTGCVRDACRVARISNTSLYRARKRLPEFDRRCREALELARPSLQEVAHQRAVEGWEDPVFQGGKLVGYRRKYAHAVLVTLLKQKDAREAPDPDVIRAPMATMEQAQDELLRRLGVLGRRLQREKEKRDKAERARLIEWADDLRRRGLAP